MRAAFASPEAWTGVEAGNTKASQLVDRLREAILSGALGPGTKINLETVRRAFNVSLSPLREALARLIAVGLVELHDNRGYTVAPVSPGNLGEITELRMEFESLALSAAVAKGDVNWESEVMGSLHRLNRTVRDRADPASQEAWEHAHRDFHMALLAGCGMPLLLNFCLTLNNLNDRYRRIFPARTNGLEESGRDIAAEHRAIAESAVGRDAARSCDRLRAHIRRTNNNLLGQMTQELPP